MGLFRQYAQTGIPTETWPKTDPFFCWEHIYGAFLLGTRLRGFFVGNTFMGLF